MEIRGFAILVVGLSGLTPLQLVGPSALRFVGCFAPSGCWLTALRALVIGSHGMGELAVACKLWPEPRGCWLVHRGHTFPGGQGLLSVNCHRQAAGASVVAKFTQKYPLPGTELQPAAGNRYGKRNPGQCRFDMCGHIIISL